MLFKYYRGERKNPFEKEDGNRGDDIRAIYWLREAFVSHIRDVDKGIRGYPCNVWPDFIQRARVDLSERGLAFEIDFQNSKHNCGEYNENWYSYFAGPRVCWQEVPFRLPDVKIDQEHYTFTSCMDLPGRLDAKLIEFGPIVSAFYRGFDDERFRTWDKKVPVFEIENLRGDRLYVNSPGCSFRLGRFRVAGEFRKDDESTLEVHVYDKRLHAALLKLIFDESTPAICVDERLELPTLAEAEMELKWYRVET